MLNSLTSIGNSKGSILSKKLTGSMQIANHSTLAYFVDNRNLGTGPFTIEFWVKPLLFNNTLTQQAFVGIESTGAGIVIHRPSTAHGYSFAFRTREGAYYYYGNMTGSYNNSGWYHLVVQRVTGGGMQIWVNGTAMPTGFISTTNLTGTSGSAHYTFGRLYAGLADEFALKDTLMTGIRISNIARYPINGNGSAPNIIVKPTEVSHDSNTIAAFNFRYNKTLAETLTTYLTSENGAVTLTIGDITFNNDAP